MKRPMLIFGITFTIICALLILNVPEAVMLFLAALVFFFWLFIKKMRKHIIIPTVCIAAVIITLCFTIFNTFTITPQLKYDNTQNDIYGKVVTTPRKENNTVSFTIKADKIGEAQEDMYISVEFCGDTARGVELYDYVLISDAMLNIPRKADNSFDLSKASDNTLLTAKEGKCFFLWDCNKTPYYHCLRLRASVCEKIDYLLGQSAGGLLKGMLFGENSTTPTQILKDFRGSGLSHLLAVSGLHTSLWCGLLITLLRLIGVPEKPRNIICLVFLVFFCIISAFTPSVLRACLMTGIVLIAPFFKRSPDALNSLGFAASLLLLLNPYNILSISFQLSATATLGVLISSAHTEKISEKLSEKLPKRLGRVIEFIISSFLISLASSLFTAPVCAHHFGIISIASPISNIICVQLSFYGMILGMVCVALSFIPLTFVSHIIILPLRISEFLINLVISLAAALGNMKFSTIPISASFFIMGLIIGAALLLAGIRISRKTKLCFPTRLCAALSATALIVSIALPMTHSNLKNSITIVNSGSNIQLVIKSGTKYAYIENTTERLEYNTYSALPKATCEKLLYYIPTYLSYDSVYNIKAVSESLAPENIIITREIHRVANKVNLPLPHNTIIKSSNNYTLSKEITFQIVDTTPADYVIIRDSDKSVFVHLHGSTDIKSYVDEDFDVIIFNGTLPTELPSSAEEIILCADESFDYAASGVFTQGVRSTYHEGNITIKL